MLSGKLRYAEIKNILPNIKERIPTLELKKIEENKVLTRKIYAEVSPHVEYELTRIGYQLKPVINELENGAKKHKKIA